MELIRRKKKLFLPLLLLALLINPMVNLLGQTEAEGSPGILIANQQNVGRSKIVPVGQKVRLTLDSGERVKGVFESVTDDFFVVDGREIGYEEVAKIRARVSGMKGPKRGGIISLVVGGIFGILAGAMGFLGARRNNDADGCIGLFAALMIILFAITLGTLSAVFLAIGIISLAVGYSVGRSFRMGKKWKLEKFGR